ncbi:MAG: methyltransferase domain-containing protein [Candidatus Pacearchaeota archaeon]|jgi:SAM-dependent methyltransferase
MEQSKVWDSISDLWKEYRQKPLGYVVKLLEEFKGGNVKILDYGCGSGRNFVKQEGLMFYGVDFSLQQLKYAEENAKKNKIEVDLQQIKSEKLPFKDEFFDVCLFISTLHCIETAKKRIIALEEIYRTLKKDGQMVVSVWNRESLLRRFGKDSLSLKLDNPTNLSNKKSDKFKDETSKEIFMPWKFNGNVYQRYYYLYEREELKKLLENIGFKIVREISDKMNLIFIVEK